MNNQNTFSQRIKELRESLGLSQTDFAKSVGTTQTTLSAYETLERTPSLDIIKAIAEKYNISIDWLLGLRDTPYLSCIPNNYKDIISLLFIIEDSKLDTRISKATFSGEQLPAIFFQDYVMEDFLKEWGKMKAVYKNNMIDKEVYQLWKEKTLKKYNLNIASYGKHISSGSSSDPFDYLCLLDEKTHTIIEEIPWDFVKDEF